MGNVMVIDQIRNVPDLHVNYVPLHIAQKFHNLKETCEARTQEGFDIRFLVNSICTGSFLDDHWRPRQLIRNASDYQEWVASNKAENLKHFQLIVPAPVWEELGKHLQSLGFKPTYRQSTIHA